MQREAGITLLEILLSITILSMVLLLMFSVTGFNIKANIKSDDSNNGILLAENALNQIKNELKIVRDSKMQKPSLNDVNTIISSAKGSFDKDFDTKNRDYTFLAEYKELIDGSVIPFSPCPSKGSSSSSIIMVDKDPNDTVKIYEEYVLSVSICWSE